MKLILAGTPEFAALPFKAVLDAGFDCVAVYTQPDRPAGRGRKLAPSPVKQLALDYGLPVYQPLNFKTDADREQLAEFSADLILVIAYGLILPQSVLDMPRKVYPYKPGSWGPKQADALIAADGHWHNPMLKKEKK